MSALPGASFLSAITPPPVNREPARAAGAGRLDSLGTAVTTTLQQQFSAATPQPIYNQAQADEINAAVASAVEALNAGDFETATTRTRVLLRRDSANPVAYHLLGRIAAERGDLDTAIDHYDRAAALAPDNERFSNDAFNARQLRSGETQALATGAHLVQRPDQARNGVRLLYELARRSERDGEIFLNISRGFETLGLPTSQLETFEAVLEEGTREDLAVLEGELKRFISDHVPVGLAYSILGRTQFRLGKTDAAIQSLEQARAIAPETTRYTTELADVHAAVGSDALARGDLSGARFRFTQARELDRSNGDYALGLAAVHVAVAKRNTDFGLDRDARINLNRAATLLRDDRGLDGELALAFYRLGRRALAEGSSAAALSDLQKAYDRDPQIAGLGRLLGETHRAAADAVVLDDEDGDLNTEQYAQIADHHRQAFHVAPLRDSYRTDFAEALNDYGLKLMNDNQNYDDALAVFKEARALDPDNPTYLANWQQAYTLNNA